MLSSDYIVGLVDGEGSFTVYIRDPNSIKLVKRRVVVEPKFYLKLIEKDKDILYQLKEHFGCGSVYFQKDNRPNHQNCYRYEVFNWKEIETIIIPFFRKNKLKLKSKRKDFEIFCKIFQKLRSGHHHKKDGLRVLFKMKQEMH
jgi:hypothetical protein